MNNRTQVPAPSRAAPRQPAESGSTPIDILAEAASGDVHNLREWPPAASGKPDAPAPHAPAAPPPRRRLQPGRPTDAWRDALLNTLIPVVGLCAAAIGVLLLAGV